MPTCADDDRPTSTSAHVIDEEGQFHVEDDADRPVALRSSRTGWRSASSGCWALTVFYQFFTRYVLNDSAAWTEEIARYLLIGTVFVGARSACAKNNHIQVDFLYRYMPAAAGARAVDAWSTSLRIAFFAVAVGAHGADDAADRQQLQMTIVDLPMNIVYGVCLFGFAAMTVALGPGRASSNWRRGYSVLERPEHAIDGLRDRLSGHAPCSRSSSSR